MPSKSEIKKNLKPSKKATTTKKSAIEAKPLKAKAPLKKVARANGKVSISGEEKKLTPRKITKSLSPSVMIQARSTPTIEQISARAHQLWLDEGCPEGRAQIHWQEAERELAGL